MEERAQASVEYALICLLVALVAVALAAALERAGRTADFGRALHPRVARGALTPDQRALRHPVLSALVARAVPALVLERDRHGDDESVPVSLGCRHVACARLGEADPTLYVHVVRRRAGPVVQLWAYLPRSQTSHLPVRALQGAHRDDWEGLFVAYDGSGRLLGARASAHTGFNALAPWWEESRDGWAPYAGVAYLAAGSHAVGLERGDIDLAGDRWNGDRATLAPASFRLLPADILRRRPLAFAPETTPPWHKAAWNAPGTSHTGPAGGGGGRSARAARAWAQGLRAATGGLRVRAW